MSESRWVLTVLLLQFFYTLEMSLNQNLGGKGKHTGAAALPLETLMSLVWGAAWTSACKSSPGDSNIQSGLRDIWTDLLSKKKWDFSRTMLYRFYYVQFLFPKERKIILVNITLMYKPGECCCADFHFTDLCSSCTNSHQLWKCVPGAQGVEKTIYQQKLLGCNKPSSY